MGGPITTGNVVLILLGILLVASGPYIIYRTVKGVRDARRENPKASLHSFSNGINLLIAVVFFFAGIQFIRNNLRGNPLVEPPAEKAAETTKS